MPRRRSWSDDDVPFDDAWLDDLDPAPPPPAAPTLPALVQEDWEQHVARVGQAMRVVPGEADRGAPERQILYLVDANPARAQSGLMLDMVFRQRRASGAWGNRRLLQLRRGEISTLPDRRDRKLMSLLMAAPDIYGTPPHHS